jgi:hypothetical protein
MESFCTKRIVLLALLFIAQDGVGLVDLLKAFFGFLFVGIPIGMVLHRHFR